MNFNKILDRNVFKMLILTTFLLWLVPVYCDISTQLCPATGTMSLSKVNGYFYYPVDIYAPPNLFADEKSAAFKCTANDGQDSHLCVDKANFCPVTKENILDAVQRSKFLARSSVCLLKEKLMNKSEVVNVYVSGGSVTLGKFTGGCCALEPCEVEEPEMCNWSYRLVEWMNQTFPAHVNYYNLGDHGHSSEVMHDNLMIQLTKYGVPLPFTENDIFLDHSVNDNAGRGEGTSAFSVEVALEMLIRKFYALSTPHSLPNFILLDGDPTPHEDRQSYYYYLAYEKVAHYYNIPVWSYRDVSQSTYSNVQQSQFINFTNWKYSADNHHHPPWYVHWYMADLYGSIMNYEMNQWCDLNVENNKVLFYKHQDLQKRAYSELPPPRAMNITDECEDVLLDLSYTSITKNLHTVGSYYFEPANGWQLRMDGNRTGGFIADLNTPLESKVIFTLNITRKELVEKKVEIIVAMQYLRSYDNGGQARVSYCGTNKDGFTPKHSGKLDGLWQDHATYHYSLPDKWSPSSSFFSYDMCENSKQEKPSIEVSYQYENDPSGERGQQKFKILSMKVCRVKVD